MQVIFHCFQLVTISILHVSYFGVSCLPVLPLIFKVSQVTLGLYRELE